MSFATPIYPGIDLEANEGPLLKTVSIAFITLTACTIAIRFFSRWYTKISLGLDELFVSIAAILSIAYTAVIIVEVNNNFYGQHVHKSDPEHLEAYLKGLYALALLYPIALSTSKLSLLALYWRVFAVTGGRVPILFASAINAAWGIAAVSYLLTTTPLCCLKFKFLFFERIIRPILPYIMPCRSKCQ
ncbi:hypothetical protein BCIN_15g03810 [Botrytis cinerea B05.10]|uniref:Rhodopsin domain-containing protein n=1 Tax=Botryotinia fuckeliana (strain B05.10) TaxID=332648 RepID=A0A384K5N5_BOTFB|nr:hypothetical protein BCIN_15g03810 [Botrytis cinerea B05.10]ATZ57857.1 hypothetical protein BCIN_15g03810 [Botrytis cinerea B05.10]